VVCLPKLNTKLTSPCGDGGDSRETTTRVIGYDEVKCTFELFSETTLQVHTVDTELVQQSIRWFQNVAARKTH
jgi:hypothetical protein